jgi:hypothetical protein
MQEEPVHNVCNKLARVERHVNIAKERTEREKQAGTSKEYA